VFAGSGNHPWLLFKGVVFEADCTRTSSLIIMLTRHKRPLTARSHQAGARASRCAERPP